MKKADQKSPRVKRAKRAIKNSDDPIWGRAAGLYPHMKKWDLAKCAKMGRVFGEWAEILRAHVAAMGEEDSETFWN